MASRRRFWRLGLSLVFRPMELSELPVSPREHPLDTETGDTRTAACAEPHLDEIVTQDQVVHCTGAHRQHARDVCLFKKHSLVARAPLPHNACGTLEAATIRGCGPSGSQQR